ncbi:MAG: flagellar hook-length control protein FliK [Treponema sp.]|nr:flagellar hook-length control protein FliK [Treponema sp.]
MELTEILVAVKPADIQKPSLQEPVREYSRNGQSFSDLLKGISAEETAPSPKEEVKNAGQVENKDEVSSRKESEPKKFEEKVEKNEESASTEEVKEEDKSRTQDPYAYAALNLVKEENKNAIRQTENDDSVRGIAEVKEGLLEKIAQAEDSERIKTLTNGNKLEVSPDFEFEIVSDDILALERAQNLSVENPLDFLAAYENAGADELAAGEKGDKSPLDKLKTKINVTDLRTEKQAPEKITSDPAEPKLKVTMTGNDSATIEMNLNQSQAQNLVNNDVLSTNGQVAASDGSNFQAMLNNQIQANAAEIVKAGNIVLKDNNKGTINLVLHPDDIGNVKLTLSLDGDKITGHIAVNTKEALEVFKNNAESLREAFMKNGFESASFDVSYNSSSSGSQHFAENNQQEQNTFFGRREYDSLNMVAGNPAAETNSEDFSEISKFGINIVA